MELYHINELVVVYGRLLQGSRLSRVARCSWRGDWLLKRTSESVCYETILLVQVSTEIDLMFV